MTFLSKYLVFPLAFLSSLALAEGYSGLIFAHRDWELACDNTRTCRAAGYDTDSEMGVSVLLTRKAGPYEPVTGRIGHYREEDPAFDSLPSVFKLSLRINEHPVGQVTISKESFVTDLTPKQVAALLAALVRESRIELTTGDNVWSLSNKGAAAVLLKMDEFQGRNGTPGALVRKGSKEEETVLPPVPVPVVIAAPLPEPLPEDQLFAEKASSALLESLALTENFRDDCPMLAEAERESAGLTAIRLSNTKMLISALCRRAAYNEGNGFWVINASPPYQPILVTASGFHYGAGRISASQKGRGLGDCWYAAAWTWDGKQFVHTEESSTGMCRFIAPGGAWHLPTIVTDVRSSTSPEMR